MTDYSKKTRLDIVNVHSFKLYNASMCLIKSDLNNRRFEGDSMDNRTGCRVL